MKNYTKEQIWDNRFLKIAREVGKWTSCIRHQVGCVVVKDRRIISTGYNGAPAGIESCREKNICLRNEKNIASGTMHEMCYAVHAEQNAICQAAKLGISLEDSTLYVTFQPCVLCTKMIINAGIKRIVFINAYPDDFSKEIMSESKIVCEQLDIIEDLD